MEMLKAFILVFSGASDNVRSYVKSICIEGSLREVEQSVDQCSKSSADQSKMTAAKNLYTSVIGDLERLKNILGTLDLHYLTAADRVSAELLICSTTHYNTMIKVDGTSLPLDESEKITNWAKLTAASQRQKDEVEEDLRVMAGLREKMRTSKFTGRLNELIAHLIEKDKRSTDKSWIPYTLQTFFNNIKSPLSQLGDINYSERDEISDVASFIAISLVISYVNESEEYAKALMILDEVRGLRMNPDTRVRLNDNISIIKSNLESSKAAAGGCYIATLAYGSYDDPQVLKLRKYRDEVLSETKLGRLFIWSYYAVSPHMVSVLKSHTRVHEKIKNLLDKLIQRMGL